MKVLVITTAILAATVATVPAFASDIIPYPTIGTVAPTPNLIAASTGMIELFYIGFSAADTDEISLCDTTAGPASGGTGSSCTGYIFDNKTTAPGATAFLPVTGGDTLEVFIDNLTTGHVFSSNPVDSFDGVNHTYATPYTATSPIFPGAPVGTFIGEEDLTDFDYNDDQFVFTDIAGGTGTPEPATFMLIGLGLTGLAVIQRRSKKSI